MLAARFADVFDVLEEPIVNEGLGHRQTSDRAAGLDVLVLAFFVDVKVVDAFLNPAHTLPCHGPNVGNGRAADVSAP